MEQQQQRAALGRVSSSRLNAQRGASPSASTRKPAKARLSMGVPAPRYSLGGGATAQKKKSKRMSMMPAVGGGRRQSMASVAGGPVGGGRRSMALAVKSDPRPLNDKGYMRASVETLIRFLVEHNYDQAISPKILHRPTGKDFENLVMFLFGLLDPHRRPGKFADDVTLTFKGLRYPFNISKTALAAVGSPHTWPALLASLTWLVELLEYDEVTGLGSEDFGISGGSAADDLDSDKHFFTYLQRAYAYFLAGDDESSDALDNERKSFILEDQAKVRQTIEAAAQTKAALDKQLREEESMPSLIPDLEQRKRDFESDKLKWDKLIMQFENNKEVMLSKVREREAECRAKEEELAAAQRRKADIQGTLDSQELSPADAERMNQLRRGLDEAQNNAIEHRDEVQKKIWDLEMSISKRAQAVEATIEEYNEVAKTLRLVQDSSGSREGANIVLRLDPATDRVCCVGRDGALATDVDAGAIKRALQELQEVSHNKLHQVRTESMELKVAVEENDEEKASVQAEVKALEQRLEALEREYDEEKAAMEEELARRASETEQVEEAIHHESQAGELREPLEASRLEVRALESQLEAFRQSSLAELAVVDEELNRAIELCCSFSEETGEMVAGLEAELREEAAAARASCEAKLREMEETLATPPPEAPPHAATTTGPAMASP